MDDWPHFATQTAVRPAFGQIASHRVGRQPKTAKNEKGCTLVVEPRFSLYKSENSGYYSQGQCIHTRPFGPPIARCEGGTGVDHGSGPILSLSDSDEDAEGITVRLRSEESRVGEE